MRIDIDRTETIDLKDTGNDLGVTECSLSSKSNIDDNEVYQPLVNTPASPKIENENCHPRTISTSSTEASKIPCNDETSCVGKPDNTNWRASPEFSHNESETANALSQSLDDTGRIQKLIEKVIKPDFTSTLRRVLKAGQNCDEVECSGDGKGRRKTAVYV